MRRRQTLRVNVWAKRKRSLYANILNGSDSCVELRWMAAVNVIILSQDLLATTLGLGSCMRYDGGVGN